MSSTITTTAGATHCDCTIKGQLDRMGSRPLSTTDPNDAKFSSIKGRFVSFVELAHTLVREPYRALKNLALIAEKIFNFVRSFFETLFGEHNWQQFGTVAEDLGSTLTALPMRLVTWAMDISKLFAGIFYPAAAIKS